MILNKMTSLNLNISSTVILNNVKECSWQISQTVFRNKKTSIKNSRGSRIMRAKKKIIIINITIITTTIIIVSMKLFR